MISETAWWLLTIEGRDAQVPQSACRFRQRLRLPDHDRGRMRLEQLRDARPLGLPRILVRFPVQRAAVQLVTTTKPGCRRQPVWDRRRCFSRSLSISTSSEQLQQLAFQIPHPFRNHIRCFRTQSRNRSRQQPVRTPAAFLRLPTAPGRRRASLRSSRPGPAKNRQLFLK